MLTQFSSSTIPAETCCYRHSPSTDLFAREQTPQKIVSTRSKVGRLFCDESIARKTALEKWGTCNIWEIHLGNNGFYHYGKLNGTSTYLLSALDWTATWVQLRLPTLSQPAQKLTRLHFMSLITHRFEGKSDMHHFFSADGAYRCSFHQACFSVIDRLSSIVTAGILGSIQSNHFFILFVIERLGSSGSFSNSVLQQNQ